MRLTRWSTYTSFMIAIAAFCLIGAIATGWASVLGWTLAVVLLIAMVVSSVAGFRERGRLGLRGRGN